MEFAARAHRGGDVEVAFVQLAELREPELAALAIRDAISEHEADPVSERAFFDSLHDRTMLVILDNLEQVVGAALVFARLLDAGSGIRLLATSRLPLRIEAEQEFPLAPFATEAGTVDSDAVALFAERARAVEPGFVLDAANAADIAAICRRLDGLPLAIELAAARIGVLSPASMRARLEQAPLNPGPGRRDAPERQQTLSNAIDWSYRLLSESERRLMCVLSVFAGSFSLEMGDALWTGLSGGFSLPRFCATAFDAGRSQPPPPVPGRFGDRFGMLQTIRSFAQDQLAVSADVDHVRDRHAGLVADFVQGTERPAQGPVPRDVLAREDAEIDNIRAALAWAGDRPGGTDFFRLVASLGRYWIARGGLWRQNFGSIGRSFVSARPVPRIRFAL